MVLMESVSKRVLYYEITHSDGLFIVKSHHARIPNITNALESLFSDLKRKL